MTQIGAASSANSQLNAQISLAVAKKTQEVQEAQGQAAIALLESAAELQSQTSAATNGRPYDPNLGQLLDTVG